MRGEEYPRMVIAAAEACERRFYWRKAASIYASLVSSRKLPRRIKAENLERMGHAYFRASFQSDDSKAFRANIQKAIGAYKIARTLLNRRDREGEAQSLHSMAMEAYLQFWLAGKASSKKRFVTKSWTLAKKAMDRFKTIGHAVGLAQAFDLLSPAVPVALNLEWNPSKRTLLFDEAIEYGRSSIEMLSDISLDKDNLARVCARVALFIDASREERGQVIDQDKLDKEGRSYWQTAVRINEEQALAALPRPPDGFYHIFDNEQSRDILEKALKVATRSKDKFAIGWLHEQLAGFVFWDGIMADDTKQSAKFAQKSLSLAERALEGYRCFNFSSPGASVMWPNSPHAEHFLQLSWFQLDREKRRLLLTKSIHEGAELLRIAKRSSYPKSLAYAHHVASNARIELAEFEPNPFKKRRLIEEALDHRTVACSIVEHTQPRSLWKRGVYLTYMAETIKNLAELEPDRKTKRRLLLEAIQINARALELSTKYVKSIPWGKSHPLHGALGRHYADYGQILLLAYETLEEEKHLADAADVFTEAVEWCRKSGTPNRGVAAYSWKAGRAHDRLQDYSTAAREFVQASEAYQALARKVAVGPSYRERARYLRGWSTVEQARACHSRLQYEKAGSFYRKAARIYKSTRRWNFLAPYYKSIAELEHAEALGRLGEDEEAIQAFDKASTLFQAATGSLEAQFVEQEQPEEKTLVERLVKEPVTEYCSARILIEEAKRAQNQGDHRTASLKFHKASKKLDEAANSFQTSEERKESLLIASLSEGLALMTQGIAENSNHLLQQARDKFETSSTFGYNQNSHLLSRAYSLFCQGMEAGNEFTRTSGSNDYGRAIKYLTTALECFMKSGFTIPRRQANVSRHFLDTQFRISEAIKPKDQIKKASLLEMGMTLLDKAADLFGRAHQPAAKDEATKLFDRLREEQTLYSNLAEVSKTVSNHLGDLALPVPTRWGGTAPDFPGVQGVDIEANLKSDKWDDSTGSQLKAVLEIANVGTKSVRIVRLENMIPEGSSLVETPSFSRIQGSTLIMGGMKVAPSNIEKVPITIKIGDQGFVLIRPRLIFLDEKGKQLELDLPPGFLGSSKILEFLSLQFIRDFSVKKLAPAHAGWRTFMEIVRALKVSRSQFYGDLRRGQRYGRQVEALMKAGLVELRVFPGERGRGGQIVKIRLAFDNNVARQYAETLQSRIEPVKSFRSPV